MVRKNIIAGAGLLFSKAVIHSDKYTMEISGQIGLNSEGKLLEGIERQTVQTLNNVKDILESVGWKIDNLIKARIYLTDMKDYAKVNEIYGKYFEENNSIFPTRVALAVKELPLGALIEIDGTAARDNLE